MSDTSGIPQFDQVGSSDQFPTSGSSTSADDTLFGVTKALGVVPVAVKRQPQPTARDILELPGGFAGLGQASPTFDIQPLESVVAQFDRLDPSSRAKLQENLMAAGYYSSSYYGKNPPIVVPGENDPASRAAWKAAVEDASRQSTYDPATHQLSDPKTVQDVITERISNRQAQGIPAGGAASTRAPLVTQLTNPDDIRAAVVAAAKSELGHKVDEATINDIITRYQQADAAAQAGVYGAQPGGGTVTAAPSVSTFARQQVTVSDPTDAAAHRGLGVGNLILNAFMSSGGNAPTGGTGG